MKRKLIGGPAHGRTCSTPSTTGFLGGVEGGHYSRFAASAGNPTKDFYWVEGVDVPLAILHGNRYEPVNTVTHDK